MLQTPAVGSPIAARPSSSSAVVELLDGPGAQRQPAGVDHEGHRHSPLDGPLGYLSFSAEGRSTIVNCTRAARFTFDALAALRPGQAQRERFLGVPGSSSHGRRENRTIKVLTLNQGSTSRTRPKRSGSNVAAQAHEPKPVVHRDRLRDHRSACPSRQTRPAGALGRGHWSIENKVHWVRDVTYDED
jgi:hypothetical protein